MKSLLAPDSWIVYPWQEADEDTFPVVQLDAWMIFLITGQEYVRSYCKNQHLGTEIITDFWCLDQGRNCSLVPRWLSSTSVLPPLGQWRLRPPGPYYKMAAQPECLQPLTFRVEGVGMPPGSTTDQSRLHELHERETWRWPCRAHGAPRPSVSGCTLGLVLLAKARSDAPLAHPQQASQYLNPIPECLLVSVPWGYLQAWTWT